jgi:hypothetical protein
VQLEKKDLHPTSELFASATGVARWLNYGALPGFLPSRLKMSILGQTLTGQSWFYTGIYTTQTRLSLVQRLDHFCKNTLTHPFLSAIAREQAMCEAVLLKVNMIKTIRNTLTVIFFSAVRITGRVQPEAAVPKSPSVEAGSNPCTGDIYE